MSNTRLKSRLRSGQQDLYAARPQKGFTLIETLVALALMGFTTLALMVLIGQNARFQADVRARVDAAILADNEMVRVFAMAQNRSIGGEREVVDLRGREWIVSREITDLDFEGLMRVDVAVRLDDEGAALARRSSIVKPGRR